MRRWLWLVALAVLIAALPLAAGSATGAAPSPIPRGAPPDPNEGPAPPCPVKVASSTFLTKTPYAISNGKAICTTVVVPLDRSHSVPGTVKLHVEVLPAKNPVGTMFVFAGGPGQGSAWYFRLTDPKRQEWLRYLFPNYTLVAYDNRGTGHSGLLHCPSLTSITPDDVKYGPAGACARFLGPRRNFYGTADNAQDIESVRTALNFQQIGLYGTSYGTEQVLAYALAYPAEVDRILLDSVRPIPYDEAGTYRELPKALANYCAGGLCRKATPNYANDVVVLANRLGQHHNGIPVLMGPHDVEMITAPDLISVVVDADLSPGLAAMLPAAVRAARLGHYRQLVYIRDLEYKSNPLNQGDSFAFSGTDNVVTNCVDGPVPWTPDTPVAKRLPLIAAELRQLPGDVYGRFGRWLDSQRLAYYCEGWPAAKVTTPLGAGPLPNVPMLAVDGGFDMRTTNADARAVTGMFPQGHLLIVPGLGHAAIIVDPSGCARREVRAWVVSGTAPSGCARPTPDVLPLPLLPTGNKKLNKPQTKAAVQITVHTAEADWDAFLYAIGGPPLPGLEGGTLTSTANGFTLNHFSVIPAVEVSGRFHLKSRHPLEFSGKMQVGG